MWGTYRSNARAGRHRRDHGRRDRRDPGDGELPVLRRQQVRARPIAELFTNPAVARQYEPGSVMKAFTVAAALDAGAITTTRHVQSTTTICVIGDVRIQNADRYDSSLRSRRRSPPATCWSCRTTSARRRSASSWAARACTRRSCRFGFGGADRDRDLRARRAAWSGIPDGPNASGDLTAAQNAFGQGLRPDRRAAGGRLRRLRATAGCW